MRMAELNNQCCRRHRGCTHRNSPHGAGVLRLSLSGGLQKRTLRLLCHPLTSSRHEGSIPVWSLGWIAVWLWLKIEKIICLFLLTIDRPLMSKELSPRLSPVKGKCPSQRVENRVPYIFCRVFCPKVPAHAGALCTCISDVGCIY